MHDLVIFVVLGSIFYVCERLEHLSHAHKARAKRLMWLVVFLTHPVSLRTLEEFVIHLVVYSGRLIPVSN